MALVAAGPTALAAPKAKSVVPAPATVLIGHDFGNGRFIFDVPRRLADCPKEIEARAYTAYSETLQKWRADRAGLQGAAPPKPVNLASLHSLNLVAPKELKALADGTWSAVKLTATTTSSFATAFATVPQPSANGTLRSADTFTLIPYVAANESYTPCWMLGTNHWREPAFADREMTLAIATRTPTSIRALQSVAKAMTSDNVPATLQTDFAKLVARTPALTNRLQTLFSDAQGRAMDWKLIAAQQLSAKYQGKPTAFWSATVLVDSGHTLTMIVNDSSKELCWWHAGTEDEMEDKTVLALAIRPRDKSDWWLVKNQLYDGSTMGLIEPVATRDGCRIKTITTTGYSG